MLVLDLVYEDDEYAVGIVELVNKQQKTANEIIKLALTNEKNILAVQFLDSSLVVDADHLLFAAQNAINAWRGRYAITRELGLELMVYASAQRQIDRAIEVMGIKNELVSLALVIVGTDRVSVETQLNHIKNEVGSATSDQFSMSEERLRSIMNHFNIQDKELQAITVSNAPVDIQKALSRCVISRVSMTALES
ncbi:MAG: KEOPS complex subunit Cgi121 [Candidatus Thorarchaeota archaeon]|jgi:KEOPS complex subunit Cgi121